MFIVVWLFSISYLSYMMECDQKILKVYGDVHKDKRFFEETLPWLIGNVGGHVKCEIHLLGSGRYSVPQKCALLQLEGNLFLQAEYLKCEAAEMNPPEACLCYVGIEPVAYRTCVFTKGWMVRDAYDSYSEQYNMLETPIVDFESQLISGHEEDYEEYLERICMEFDKDKRPYTCKNPLSFANMYRGAVLFDCDKVDNSSLVQNLDPDDFDSLMSSYSKTSMKKRASSFKKMKPNDNWLALKRSVDMKKKKIGLRKSLL